MDQRGESLFGPRHRLITIAILGLVAVNAFDGIAVVASGFRAAHLGALALVLTGVVAAALLRRWPAGARPRA